MTMKIVFQKDKDGYKKDKEYFVERSLARRFCENNIAITYQQHIDNIYDAEQAEIKAKEKAEKLKKEAEEKKKADLLKEKESSKSEKAVSGKQVKSEKAVKK